MSAAGGFKQLLPDPAHYQVNWCVAAPSDAPVLCRVARQQVQWHG